MRLIVVGLIRFESQVGRMSSVLHVCIYRTAQATLPQIWLIQSIFESGLKPEYDKPFGHCYSIRKVD